MSISEEEVKRLCIEAYLASPFVIVAPDEDEQPKTPSTPTHRVCIEVDCDPSDFDDPSYSIGDLLESVNCFLFDAFECDPPRATLRIVPLDQPESSVEGEEVATLKRKRPDPEEEE